MTCCTNCFAILFASIVWIELISGLVATTSAAFFNDKVKFWAYLIFVIDAIFASWLFYYSGKETFTYLKDTATNKSVTMNWICGMCTVVTIAIFGSIYFFTPLGHPALEIVWGAFAIYIIAIFLLWIVATIYMIYLRLGCAQPSSNNRPKERSPNPPTRRDPEMSLEQSLNQIVDNVQNNPEQKGYTLYAVGSETPFQVRM
ncbi:hypothetical protein Ocin01_07289 [Orchesella cincta]|uniref:Uncharacterized protein n=1 Tax=Orchesella cincta TaxID=48709 RepID=A0A1D2N398_ORCCI|nr:hypothetical protein Ocin01_07289 [Orchesella cincta]